MPRAFSYIRFSSTQQGQGSSTERQQALIDDWLESHPDYTQAAPKIDRGKSAYKGEHKKHDLGLILKLIEDGETQEGDVLLVEAMDRLSREDPTDALDQFIKIVKAGVTIVTLEDGQSYDRATTKTGTIYGLLGKIQQANAYSESLSRRIKASMNARRTKAKAGEGFGLSTSKWIDAKNRQLVEPYATIVRRAIALYLDGLGTREVSKQIRDEFKQHESVSKLNASTVSKWLKDEALIGRWGDIENAFEPLLNIDEYVLLKETVKRRSKFIPSPQLNDLSGLVKCACCDNSYNFRTQKPKPTKVAPAGSEELKNKPSIIYGSCSNYLKNKACSNNSSLPYEVIFELHKEACQGALYEMAFELVTNRSKSKELKELEQTRSRLSIQYDRLLDQYIEHGLESAKEKADIKAKEFKSVDLKIKELRSLLEPSEGLEFDNPQHRDPFSEAINTETQRLLQNPKTLRENLKAQGYRLLANRMTVTHGNVSYEVLKRSQKHLCYLVKRTEKDEHSDTDTFMAITREGSFGSKVLAHADSDGELLDQLKTKGPAVHAPI